MRERCIEVMGESESAMTSLEKMPQDTAVPQYGGSTQTEAMSHDVTETYDKPPGSDPKH